ncbi:reverse transcriptase domain-containing protein [Tanacetum coccineum]
MKQLIAELPMLTAPMEKEELIVYLVAAKVTVGVVLMTKREAKQIPIYFVSRALKGSMKDMVIPLRDLDENNMLHLAAKSTKIKNLEDVSGAAL